MRTFIVTRSQPIGPPEHVSPYGLKPTWKPDVGFILGSMTSYFKKNKYPYSIIAEIIKVEVKGKDYVINVTNNLDYGIRIDIQQDDLHFTVYSYEEAFKILENN